MTPAEQRIAIAEWCGFINKPTKFDYCGESGIVDNWTLWGPNGQVLKSGLPDYLNDLNAMHEAELKLVPDNSIHGRVRFDNLLTGICGSHQACVSATPAQRAEALLRTIGNWTEHGLSLEKPA